MDVAYSLGDSECLQDADDLIDSHARALPARQRLAPFTYKTSLLYSNAYACETQHATAVCHISLTWGCNQLHTLL